jgi:hypothetical protein
MMMEKVEDIIGLFRDKKKERDDKEAGTAVWELLWEEWSVPSVIVHRFVL